MATRALKLYVSASCPFCQRAEIVAREKKLAYERVVVELGANMPQWYKALNPRETVPTLEVGAEKRLVFESTLIAQYLDNVGAPAGSLQGSTPQQRYQVEFFLSQVGDFVDAAYALLRDPLSVEKRQALEDNAAYIDGLLEANQTTGPFYFDAEFTLADVALVPFLVRLRPALAYYAGYDVFRKAPRVKALWAAAVQRPSVRESSPTAEQSVSSYLRFVPESAPMTGAQGGYVLYGNKYCPFVDRARLACALRNFKLFWVEVSLGPQPEWYKFINPRQTVPALYTPSGEAVHESQLIVHYVDAIATEGTSLIPRDNAEEEYEVRFFIDNVGAFVGALFGLVFGGDNVEEGKKESLRAAGELERQLAKHVFGDGPYFGGKTPNAGDVAVLPFLVRAQAFSPELTKGVDILGDFPLLTALVDAGVANPTFKGIFLPQEEYLNQFRTYLEKH